MWNAVQAALPVLLCLLFPGVSTGREPPIVVVGQADITLDRPAIQAAIDRAPPGAIISLHGTFHFDGTPVVLDRGAITLAGQPIDDDADGRINEDWTDGQDNDHDGVIDEDDWNTVLIGSVDPGGRPRPDDSVTPLFNHGFVVRAASRNLADIRFRDLELRTFWRALSFAPDLEPGQGSSCGGGLRTEGALVDLRIEGNRFLANDLAIELMGAIRLARIHHNVLNASGHLSVRMLGGSRSCIEADGSTGSRPVGRPTGVRISNNRFRGTDIALMSTGSRATTIRENDFQTRSVGLATQGDDETRIGKNVFRQATIGIHASNSVDGGLIAGNTFVHNAIGILFDTGASGYAALRNTFSNSSELDILLDAASANNVVVHGGDTVRDLGTRNQVTVAK